jgi:hypothetical protein
VEKLEKATAAAEAKAEAERMKAEAAKESQEVARFKAESERLAMILPYLDQKSLAEIAATVGVQVRNTPDIAPPAGGEADPARSRCRNQSPSRRQTRRNPNNPRTRRVRVFLRLLKRSDA